jgi:hypothetical protein
MRCRETVIGLDNQAYCAFKSESHWTQLEAVARRTLVLSEVARWSAPEIPGPVTQHDSRGRLALGV